MDIQKDWWLMVAKLNYAYKHNSALFIELRWIPNKLPKNIFMIFSTLPNYGYLENLKSLFKDEKTKFREIKAQSFDDVKKVIGW